MKKYAIAIIGLVFAAFVLGSCDVSEIIKKGGTIRVTNKSEKYSVNIYITKSAYLEIDPTKPPSSYVVKKTIAANSTGDVSVGEDGIYYINAFFNMPATSITNAFEKRGTVDPIEKAVQTLAVGNTVSVDVKEIL